MKSRDVARGGLLLALTLILSYVERLAPLPVPVPGVKIGLPNLVVIFLLLIKVFLQDQRIARLEHQVTGMAQRIALEQTDESERLPEPHV